MRRLAIFALLTSLIGCADETISGYADPTAVYRLTVIDDAPFTASATITFPEKGLVRGDAPCNTWSGSQTAPYPWFAPGPIMSTQRACAHMEKEALFFATLGEMTLAEVQGGVLILSNDAGREMVFQVE